MPRNPDGSPAARSLIAALADLGTAATPRRLESLWQAGLIPKITGKGPPSPRDVAHVAAVLAMLGERKRHVGVAARTALRGFDVDDETVRRDLLDVAGADNLPASTGYDAGTGGDDSFAQVEALATRAVDSEDAVFADVRAALRLGVETAEAARPTGEAVLAQRDSLVTNVAGAYCGQAFYAPERMTEALAGVLPTDVAVNAPAVLARAAQVVAEPGHRFDAASLGGPAGAVVEGDPVVFTFAALFVEPFRTLGIPALVADARRLLPLAQWLTGAFLPRSGDAEAAELLAFGLAASFTRIPGMAAVETCHECLPTGRPAPLPSRG